LKYEVKLLLDPSKVLNSHYELDLAIKELFRVNTVEKRMDVQYLDTDDRGILQQDWSVRVRKMDGDTDLELTYKKRYKIIDGDSEAALELARNDVRKL